MAKPKLSRIHFRANKSNEKKSDDHCTGADNELKVQRYCVETTTTTTSSSARKNQKPNTTEM